MLEKSVSRRLQETPTLDTFGKGCIKSGELLAGIVTDESMLKDIANQNYDNFYQVLLKNIKNNPKI